MSPISLYVRDQQLWDSARRAAGRQGLSALVERAVRRYLQEPEPDEEEVRRYVLPVGTNGSEGDEMSQSIEFRGRLLVDSAGFSVEQLPRLRVYQAERERLLVYRTWPEAFGLQPSFSVYANLDQLRSDRLGLDATWITEDDSLGEHTDLTPDFLESVQKALRRPRSMSVDALPISTDQSQPCRPVSLNRDAAVLRRALAGGEDLDVLLVAMHLLPAEPRDPKHLATIEEAFRSLKPVSRLGNMPDDLKDLQAGMRGYLNNDTRKRVPSWRLFTNPKRGFWALSPVGNRRAIEVLRRRGMARLGG
jgi:hypothetical protein